jgi:hypothetical protein
LDTSDLIIDWVNQSGYSLIDVNVLTALPDTPSWVSFSSDLAARPKLTYN